MTHHYSPIRLYTVMSQNIALFMVTAMGPSNLTHSLLHAIQTAGHIIFYHFFIPQDNFKHTTLHDIKFSAL